VNLLELIKRMACGFCGRDCDCLRAVFLSVL